MGKCCFRPYILQRIFFESFFLKILFWNFFEKFFLGYFFKIILWLISFLEIFFSGIFLNVFWFFLVVKYCLEKYYFGKFSFSENFIFRKFFSGNFIIEKILRRFFFVQNFLNVDYFLFHVDTRKSAVVSESFSRRQPFSTIFFFIWVKQLHSNTFFSLNMRKKI